MFICICLTVVFIVGTIVYVRRERERQRQDARRERRALSRERRRRAERAISIEIKRRGSNDLIPDWQPPKYEDLQDSPPDYEQVKKEMDGRADNLQFLKYVD